MNEASNSSVPPELSSSPSLGFAITSLVLGVLALILSLFLVGGLLGIAGVIFGAIHLTGHPSGRKMAGWGIALSICGIFASIGLGAFYFKAYQQFQAAMAGMDESSVPLTAWEGVPAPDITVTTLDGETLKLSDLKGKRVILDFWATWCPPCVKEIPHFIQIVNETSREDLLLVGISNEDEAKLKSFVRKMQINFPIASATDLPSPYSDVTAIPTTFFIDRNGIIQTVITGYHDLASLREKAVASDYEGEPKPPPTPHVEIQLEQRTPQLEPVTLWQKSGFSGTALTSGDWDADGQPDIIVSTSDRNLQVLGRDGQPKGSVSLPSSATFIEAGTHQNGLRLLSYSNWGKQVTVTDRTGKQLWTYPARMGVDGAHWGDLIGDGQDEMVVGMNGGGGLHAVSPDGQKLWQYAKIGNVWNQAIVPATTTAPALVCATEAGGTIKVFDASGKLLRTLQPQNQYFSQMSAARLDSTGAIQIIATGEITVALDPQGQIAWSTPAAMDHGAWRSPSFASGDVDGDGSSDWVFRDPSGTLVVASAAGKQLSKVPGSKAPDAFILVPNRSAPATLVVLKSGMLQAFSFQEPVAAELSTSSTL